MARFLKELGINRVSVGIQSFDDRDLTFLGRRHSAENAKKALSILRWAGFENIGMDLICGMPGQGLDDWRGTLNETSDFMPEHLSCYLLSIEKGTLFWRLLEKGIIREMPQALQRRFFLFTSDFLAQRGYTHYEVSNFARDGRFRSRHNSKYWAHEIYFGLGPSAHSFDGVRRWWNVRSIRRYISGLEKGLLPVEGSETISPEKRRLESICLGARTAEGFPLASIAPCREAERSLKLFNERGLLHIINERAVPTEKGFLMADHIAASLA
jgi:oxygen-independent coproporphyrinogen-3 oxidase